MNYCIFDIETGPLADAELEKLMPTFQASKTLKDPEKIAADIEAKKQEWKNGAALNAATGQVWAIGVWSEEENFRIFEGFEKEIISNFWDHFKRLGHFDWVGHCIKNFDFPFLVRRSWILGIKPPRIMKGRYYLDTILDTMEAWSCGNYRDTISLDNLCKAFGLPGKNGSGKDFAELYAKDPNKALQYLKDDLKITKDAAISMQLIS